MMEYQRIRAFFELLSPEARKSVARNAKTERRDQKSKFPIFKVKKIKARADALAVYSFLF